MRDELERACVTEAGYGHADMAIESDEAAQVFTGGIWYREGTATWPFGHLRLGSNGVSGWLRVFGLGSPPLVLAGTRSRASSLYLVLFLFRCSTAAFGSPDPPTGCI
jgi:hypothetical protein